MSDERAANDDGLYLLYYAVCQYCHGIHEDRNADSRAAARRTIYGYGWTPTPRVLKCDLCHAEDRRNAERDALIAAEDADPMAIRCERDTKSEN